MKGKRLLALLMALSLLCGLVITPASAVSFRDAQNNWASAAIERWSEAGVVVGDENGNFNPAANMTRAEFAVVLNRVMQYQTTASNPFSDVPGDSWYSDAVLKAYAAGVISGTSPTTMSPTANLTREQAMVLLGRALGIPENASAASRFTDHSEISPFAVGYVGGMADAGYIQGNDGKVNPKANITRAEVVTILNNIITTWASKSGQTVTGTGKGITVIAAPNVTVTGRVDALMVTPGAGSGTLTLKDAKVSGTMTVTAPSVSLSLDGSASISKVVVDETAKGAAITLGKDASIGTLVSSADSVKVLGNGSINRMTVSAGSGVTVSKDVVVSTLVNDGNSGVQLGDTVVSAGQRSTAGDTGTTTKPQESKKPSGGGGGGGGGNSSSGGSSGGGGNNGGGGNTPTPTPTPIKPDGGDDNVKNITELIAAAGDNAKKVEVKVADINELTAADDVTITNNNSGLETLIIDLGSASLGDVTINAANAKTVEINGDGTFQSLTIDTPNATVENHVDVNGGVTIEAVSNNSFHLFSRVLSILLKGPGKLEIKDAAPSVPDVTVNTTAPVILAGKVENVAVTSDGANVSLNTTGSNTVVDSQGANSTITLNTSDTVTLSGTVGTVNADQNANINLTGNTTVRQLNAIKNTTISGSGTVSNVDAKSDITLNVPVGKVNVSSKTSVSISGSASVGTVTTGTSISLNVSVEKVAVISDDKVSITVAAGKTISTVETSSNIDIMGSGSVGSVDVNASGSEPIRVEVKDTAKVDQVANTGDSNTTVEVNSADTATAPTTDEVKTKAKAPTGVTFEGPTKANTAKGTITVPSGNINMLEWSNDQINWHDFTSETTEVDAGHTYYVRVKADSIENILASEPVSGVIPSVSAVTSAAITGTATVGQTLTAVANTDATAPLSYQWYLVNTEGDTAISGATGKTITLIGDYSGKEIRVRIYNEYTQDSEGMSTDRPLVKPDVSALNSVISQADTIQVGVKIETETDPGKVPAGVVFVSQADLDALTTAKNTASNALTARTQADVDKAVTALQAAIKTFQNAKKTGTMTEVDKLVAALESVRNEAQALIKDVVIGKDDLSVTPGAKWVPDATMTTLGDAIDAANNAIAENPTAEKLSAAMTNLNNAMVKFHSAIRTGAEIDDTELKTAIKTAETVKATVEVAEKAEDVAPASQWATQTAHSALDTAITDAGKLDAKTQSDVVNALNKLNAAVATFQNAASYGATLNTVGLQTAITNAEANLKSVEISEDDNVDADKTYVTQKVYDDYKAAIETAKTATGLDTQSKLQGILDTLNKATDTFNAQKKGGNVESFAVTFEAAPANGKVSVKAGDVVVNTGDTVRAGTRITITVTPATGYMLESLKINNEEKLTAVSENSITITVNEATTIAATFKQAPVEYKVTIANTSNGAVIVKNGETVVKNGDKVAEGTVLTVTDDPDANYVLDKLTVDGAEKVTGTDNQYKVTDNVIITATFKAAETKYTVTYETNPSDGTVLVKNGETVVASGTQVAENTELTIVATPTDADTHEISSVTVTMGDTTTTVNADNTGAYTFNLTGNVTAITVTFREKAKDTVTVTITAPENGNTLSVTYGESNAALPEGGVIPAGSILTITATPATGYKVTAVKAGDATLVATENGTYTHTANADVTISATFVQEVAVTIKAYGAGTLTVKNGDTTIETGNKVAVGTELTITATPTADIGYVLESLKINDNPVSPNSGTATTTVTADTTIEAVFIYEMTNPVYNVVYTLGSGVKSTVTKDTSANVYTLTLGGASTTPGIPTASITDFAQQFFFGNINSTSALTSALNDISITHYTAVAIDFSKFDGVYDLKFADDVKYGIDLVNSPILAVYGTPDGNGQIYQNGDQWCKYFETDHTNGDLGSALNASGMAFLLAEGETPMITFTVKSSDGSKAAQTITIKIVNKITYLDADTTAE